ADVGLQASACIEKTTAIAAARHGAEECFGGAAIRDSNRHDRGVERDLVATAICRRTGAGICQQPGCPCHDQRTRFPRPDRPAQGTLVTEQRYNSSRVVTIYA